MTQNNKKEILELIANSNKTAGLRQVLRMITEGTIKCVIVSTDCDNFVLNSIKETIKNAKHVMNLKIYRNFTKKELGDLCNLDVPCAVIGLN